MSVNEMSIDEMIIDENYSGDLEDVVLSEDFKKWKDNLEYLWDPYCEYITEQDIKDFRW